MMSSLPQFYVPQMILCLPNKQEGGFKEPSREDNPEKWGWYFSNIKLPLKWPCPPPPPPPPDYSLGKWDDY